MMKNGSGPITAESPVNATIADYPSTGPIFLQRGRLYVAKPGSLYASYDGQTLGEYATLGGLAIVPLLKVLNAAAEIDQRAHRTSSSSRPDDDRSGWPERTPPMGSVGYTGSYREPSADIADVLVVSVLDARGPE
jgi:hypothetical protein